MAEIDSAADPLTGKKEMSEKPLARIGYVGDLESAEPDVIKAAQLPRTMSDTLKLDRFYYQENWHDHEIPGEMERQIGHFTVYVRGQVMIPWRLQSYSGYLENYSFRALTLDRSVIRASPAAFIPWIYSKSATFTNHRHQSSAMVELQASGNGQKDSLTFRLLTGGS